MKCGKEVYDGNHEAIIDKATWNKAQELLDDSRKTHSYSFKVNSLLGGLLYCEQCGVKAYSEVSHRKYKNKVYTYHRYRCDNSKHSWKQSELNELIINEIKKAKHNPDALFEDEIVEDNSGVWKKEITDIEKKIERNMELYELGTIPVELLSGRIKQLSEKKKIAEKNLEAEQAKNKSEHSKEAFIENLKLFDNIENLSEVALRQIICLLIDKISVDGDTIKIFWGY